MISTSLKGNLTIGTIIFSVLKSISSNEYKTDIDTIKIDLSKKADILYVINELNKKAEKTEIPVLDEGNVEIKGNSVTLQNDFILESKKIKFGDYCIYFTEEQIYFQEKDLPAISLSEFKDIYKYVESDIARNRINIFDIKQNLEENYYKKNEVYSKTETDTNFVSNQNLQNVLDNIELNNEAYTKNESNNIFLTRQEGNQNFVRKDIADVKYVSQNYLDNGYYNKSQVYNKNEILNQNNTFYTKDKLYTKTELYPKTQLYTKTQIDSKISNTENTILSNVQTEYAKKNDYVSNTSLQQQNLVSKNYVDTKVQENKVQIENNLVQNYYLQSEVDTNLENLRQELLNNSSNTGSGSENTVVEYDNISEIGNNIIVSTNIIPDSNETYDLGSSDKKFRDLYLSGNSIILGNSTIKNDYEDGILLENLTIGNSQTGKIKFSVSNDLNGVSSLKIDNADQNSTQPLTIQNPDIDNLKHQQEIINSSINNLTSSLSTKVNSEEIYTQSQVNNLLQNHYTKSETFTQQEINDKIADVSITIPDNLVTSEDLLQNHYTKSETFTQQEINDKIADVSITIPDNLVTSEDLLQNHYTKSETFTQQEINDKIADVSITIPDNLVTTQDLTQNYFTQTDINNNFATKTDILQNLTEDSSNLNLSGNIIPTQNAQYDLGSAEKKIRHLYLSDNSLFIGDNKISSDSTTNSILINSLTVGDDVSGKISLGVSTDNTSGKKELSVEGSKISELIRTEIDTEISPQLDTIIQENLGNNFSATVDQAVQDKLSTLEIYSKTDIDGKIDPITEELALKADAQALTDGLALKADTQALTDGLALKASTEALTDGLALKADTQALTDGLALKASTEALTDGLALKADAQDLTDGLALKADAQDLTDGLALKADTTIVNNISDKLTEAETSIGTLETKTQLLDSTETNLSISGNVGIGTSSPTVPLEINSDTTTKLLVKPVTVSEQDSRIEIRGARPASTTDYHSQLRLTNYDNDLLSDSDSGVRILGQISGKVSDTTDNVGNLVLQTSTDGTEANLQDTMTLTKNGNVGIGLTEPGQKLEVNGNIKSNFLMIEGENKTISSASGLIFKTIDSNSITFNQGDNERMRILKNSGNVGIGTTNPKAKLHLYEGTGTEASATTGTIILEHGNAAGKSSIIFKSNTNSDSDYAYIQYQDDVEDNATNQNSLLTIGAQNDSSTGNMDNLALMPSGNVGIGTTNPSEKLEVNGNIKAGDLINKTQFFSNNDTNDNFYWYLTEANSNKPNQLRIDYKPANSNAYNIGFISTTSDWNNSQLNNFTGQHRSYYASSNLKNYEGLIVSSLGVYTKMSGGVVKGLEAITINESLPDVILTKKEMDKSVFGVISTIEDSENREDAYGNFVSVSEKEKGDNRPYINSVGEGAIWVTNKNGPIENGDYITSSVIPGYGMKQNDDFLHNYTVAKATMDCDFSFQKIPKKKIMRNSEGENILDENGFIQFEDSETEMEQRYKTRYISENGNEVEPENYNQDIHYIAAFIGCTYHCG